MPETISDKRQLERWEGPPNMVSIDYFTKRGKFRRWQKVYRTSAAAKAAYSRYCKKYDLEHHCISIGKLVMGLCFSVYESKGKCKRWNNA